MEAAARAVVAEDVAAKEREAHRHAQALATAHAGVASQTLKDPQFNEDVKSTMLKALGATGVIGDINEPRWQRVGAEEAAEHGGGRGGWHGCACEYGDAD